MGGLCPRALPLAAAAAAAVTVTGPAVDAADREGGVAVGPEAAAAAAGGDSTSFPETGAAAEGAGPRPLPYPAAARRVPSKTPPTGGRGLRPLLGCSLGDAKRGGGATHAVDRGGACPCACCIASPTPTPNTIPGPPLPLPRVGRPSPMPKAGDMEEGETGMPVAGSPGLARVTA